MTMPERFDRRPMTYLNGPVHGASDYRTPDEQDRDDLVRQMHQSPTLVPEPEYPYHTCSAERTIGFKVLQGVTYVFVIITCLAVLYGMLETYLFIQDLKEGLRQFGESLNDGGLLGN